MSTEILFLLIFFIFAVLQGIGQKRRQAERQGQPPPTDAVEGDAPTGGRERISPQPRERSRVEPFDRTAVPSRDRGRPPLRERPPVQARERAGGTQQPREGATSSEGLVPKDIWGEIMGLARGELEPPKPVEKPVPSRTPPAESREGAVRRKPSAASVLRKATPPVAPVKSELAEDDSRFRKSVREGLFGDGSARELRKAIVLREVLGPPLALRE